MSRSVQLPWGVTLQIHDEGEALSDHINREQNFFEPDILEYLSRYYSKQETILDVGANIGNHTTFFAAALNYKAIVAFEPVSDNFKLLEQNMAPFGAIYLRQVAVGAENKKIHMTINRSNMGACEVDPNGSYSVQQIRLDDIIVPPVSLIKIDTEWSEPGVLEGARNLIELDRPLILIEDVEDKYKVLLPIAYHLIRAWPDHRTYLYGT